MKRSRKSSKLRESRIDSFYRRMDLGSYLDLLRLFLWTVFRPIGKTSQTRFEFRKNSRFPRAALRQAIMVLSIRWFHAVSNRAGIDSRQLVYEYSNFRFALFVWHLGHVCRLERGPAFEASSIEKA